MIVLDASALLAFLFDEKGGERVAEVIEECCLSTVNLAEILNRFSRDGLDSDLVRNRIGATQVDLVPFGAEDAALTARLAPKTQHVGLSLGDRACLALALLRGVPALTADADWARLDLGIEIELIR